MNETAAIIVHVGDNTNMESQIVDVGDNINIGDAPNCDRVTNQ